MSANGRNRGYIGRNRITDPRGVIDGRQSYLNEEEKTYNYGPDWARPADWLPIPGYTFGEQVVYALVAVTNDEDQSNSIGFQISGNHIIDWGDGATGSFSAGTAIRRTYSFNSISSSTQTSEGFRQVLVKITPQSGQNLTSVNFAVAGITTASSEMPSKFLELNMNLPSCTTLTLRTTTNTWIRKVFLNRIGSPVNFNLSGLQKLESLFLPSTGWTPANAASFMTSLVNLKSIPPFNPSHSPGGNWASMFAGVGMEVLPNLNYTQIGTLDRLFQASWLKWVPFVFRVTTTLTGGVCETFRNCYFLEYVKGIDCPNTANLTLMFSGCAALKEVEGITLTSATTFQQMFLGCSSLEKIGSFNGGTSSTSISEMFSSCGRLKTAPSMDLRNCTNGFRAFNFCGSLETVPGYTFGNNAVLTNMFGGCSSLRQIGEMNFANIRTLDTGAGSGERFTFGCFALERFPVKNLRVSWNLSNSRFGFTALSEIFAGLSGASGGAATLNITGNPGATFITAAQIAGATALGWTITR